MDNATSYQALIGCFAINFLIAGAARLSPILFVESMIRYNVDRKNASFPYVLTYMMRHLSGPVVGYMVQIFGIQIIIVAGSILATVSIGACFFAEDILAVTLLWGVILGLSFGLAHHMLPSVLNHHFPSRESTANGISLSGACIGGIVLPIILEASLHKYGLSGSFLVLSAIIAHSIPAALLIKNPAVNDNAHKTQKISKNGTDSNNKKQTNKTKVSLSNPNFDSIRIKSTLPQILPPPPYDMAASEIVEKVSNTKCVPYAHEISMDSNCVVKSKNSKLNAKILNKDVKWKLLEKTNKFTLKNFDIFTDSTYFIILIINCGSTFVVTTVWTVILDFVRDKGVDKSSEIYFVICLPLSDLIGRFGSGFAIDKNFIKKSNMTLLCFFCTIFSLIAFILASNSVLILLCEFFISIFSGAIFLLQIVLIHEFMEAEKRNMAMACRFILYPPISLLTSPMIGYFRGTQGSYDNVFYILCGISLFCGCSAYFIPHLVKRRKKPISSSAT